MHSSSEESTQSRRGSVAGNVDISLSTINLDAVEGQVMYSMQRQPSASPDLYARSTGPSEDIQLVDLHSTPSRRLTTTTSTRLIHPTLAQRAGRWIVITNVASALLLVLSIPMLTFLWLCSDKNEAWRRIMINGWLPQAVTLSTIAVRLAVATQSGTAVSMLASVLLEYSTLGGVPRKDASAVSLARYVNSGPLTTVPTFWQSLRWKLNGHLFIIVFTLMLTTLTSQFTSTLLLWDVDQGHVSGFGLRLQMPVGFSMQNYVENFPSLLTRSPNYWLASPPGYPTFAEYSKESTVASSEVDDTGPSIRAFLPFSSEQDRVALLEYSGMASVFDTRVVCVRPVFPSWSFIADEQEIVHFKGTVMPSPVAEDLADVLSYVKNDTGHYFHCPLGNMFLIDDPTSKICIVRKEVGGLMSSIDAMQNKTLNHSYDRGWNARSKKPGQTWPVELGNAVLIVSAQDTSLSLSDLDDYPRTSFGFSMPVNRSSTSFTVHQREAWLDFTPDPSKHSTMNDTHPNANISITLCYDTMPSSDGLYRIKHNYDISVIATRRANASEPRIRWDSANRKFDTRNIMSQLIPDQQEYPPRAILDLDINQLNEKVHAMSADWDPNWSITVTDGNVRDIEDEHGNSLSTFGELPFVWYPSPSMGQPPADQLYPTIQPNFTNFLNSSSETYDFLNSVIWFPFMPEKPEIEVACRTCTLRRSSQMTFSSDLSVALNTVFKDILETTASPALAWQALLTMVLRMAYYDWLPTFDYTANATVTSMVPCQTPQHTTGFTIVMVNLLLHLVAFATAVCLFCSTTQHSRLGQSWQVVAQLQGTATEDLLQEATMLDDKEVEKRTDPLLRKRRLVLREDREGERVCLQQL